MTSPFERSISAPEIINTCAEGRLLTFPDIPGRFDINLVFPGVGYLDAEMGDFDGFFGIVKVEIFAENLQTLGKKGIGTELVHQFLAKLVALRKEDARFASLCASRAAFISVEGCALMARALRNQAEGAITFIIENRTIENNRVKSKTVETISPQLAKTKMEEYVAIKEDDPEVLPPFGVSCRINLDLLDVTGWKLPSWEEYKRHTKHLF